MESMRTNIIIKHTMIFVYNYLLGGISITGIGWGGGEKNSNYRKFEL